MRSWQRWMVVAASSVAFVACGTEAGNGDVRGQDGSAQDAAVDAEQDGTGGSDVSPYDGALGYDGASLGPDSVGTTVADDLIALREEEKLARDVYLKLFDVFGLPIHKNIAGSEQTHTDAVLSALTAAGIEDPVKDDTVGVFTSATFAKLYEELVGQGSKSELDALVVGATIEDLDLYDIEEMRKRTDDLALLSLYDSLACGSRNHLRSFTSQIASRQGSYSPQYIDQATFDAILASPSETCGGSDGNGGGRGRGRGGRGGGGGRGGK